MAHLPPLLALRALEAAVRHRSYSQAASELNVTHSAISHQIRHLEQELGTALFKRIGNGMEPLPVAKRLATSVNAALALLGRAVEEADARRSVEPLVLSVEQGFARHWLVSRLGDARAAIGGCELDIRLENSLADLVGDGIDGAIRFGDGRWAGFEVTLLFPVHLFPVCSPALLEGRTLSQAADLLAFPLLRHTHPLWSWPAWFRSLGVTPPSDRGLMFDDSSLMLEAAAQGFGAALARSNLAQNYLRSGRLVRPVPDAVECAFSYYFVCRADVARRAEIGQLRDWLLAQCATRYMTYDE